MDTCAMFALCHAAKESGNLELCAEISIYFSLCFTGFITHLLFENLYSNNNLDGIIWLIFKYTESRIILSFHKILNSIKKRDK